MEEPVKRKVVKVSGYNASTSRPTISTPRSRPGSPFKPTSSSSPRTPQASISPPLLRPKAKVNSSATIHRKVSTGSSVSGTSRVIASTAGTSRPISRPNSPFKPTSSRPPSPLKSTPSRINGGLKPASAVKARVTLRPPSKSIIGASAPSSPVDSRQRSLTAVAADAQRTNHERQRSGSFSLHRQFSSSSLSTSHTLGDSGDPSPTPSPRNPPSFLPSTGGLQPIKIKSKVTGLAKASADTTSPVSPSLPSARPTHVRSRVPSISSSVSISKAPSPPASGKQFYPITTAVPAANPHRFPTTRNSPPSNQHSYRPFLPNDDQFINYTKPNTGPKVDPATIPLPPLSPPTSALSFSSHSSVSYNTETSQDGPRTFSALGSRVNHEVLGHKRGLSVRSAADIPINGHKVEESARTEDPEVDRESGSESTGGSEHKVKAEAKSIRKIADLEITNRSLMTINSSLEATKHRQAKEIRDLRRKLRESRLILPPRAFQAVKSSLDHDDTASEGDDDEDEENDAASGTEDEVYKRVKVIIDGLIETGNNALKSQPEDFVDLSKGGAKVLHAEEVRMWRRDSGVGDDSMHQHDLTLDDSMSSSRPISPSHIAVPDSDVSSEGEVEAMTSMILAAAPPGVLPPITVTDSS